MKVVFPTEYAHWRAYTLGKLTEPAPQVKLYNADRHWHAGKVLFEKHWLHRWC